jgi:hypothetical protein
MPLLADLFYGQSDLEDRYGLTALRKAVGATETVPESDPPASEPSPGGGAEP